MGDVTQGARLPDREFSRRLSDPSAPALRGGEYGRVLRDGGWAWMCMTPNGLHGSLTRHAVTEHDDGTITVEPSILVDQGEVARWHGYLRHGVWESVDG